jgi:hypothetical protein
MIPGRKLSFPTTSSVGQSSSQRSSGTSAVPSERDIRTKIAAIQRGFGSAGVVKYFGVSKNKRILNPYNAQVKVDGKIKHLGDHPTGEAAAHAYDAFTCTIPGRNLNFPNAGTE